MGFFNFSTAFLASMMMAWTRHGQSGEEELRRVLRPSRLKRLGMFQSVTIIEDLLTLTEKETVKRMLESGGLSFRSAAREGLTRAKWNRIRASLVSMKLAEYGDTGELIARARLVDYVNHSPNEGIAADTGQNGVSDTTQTRHTLVAGWGSGHHD